MGKKSKIKQVDMDTEHSTTQRATVTPGLGSARTGASRAASSSMRVRAVISADRSTCADLLQHTGNWWDKAGCGWNVRFSVLTWSKLDDFTFKWQFFSNSCMKITSQTLFKNLPCKIELLCTLNCSICLTI